jgi:DNA-directed RNA polymerase subunit F
MVKNQKENTTRKRGSRKPKPAYPEQPEFIVAPHSDMLPLYPEPRALDAAKSALEALRPEYPDFFSNPTGGISQNEDEKAKLVESSLREAAHIYWFKRRMYEQKSSEEFNSDLVEIREIAEKLRNTLASAKPLVRNQLISWFQIQARARGRIPAPYTQTDLQKIDDHLGALIKACAQRAVKRPSRGRKPVTHVTSAVTALVKLWKSSGRKFPLRFDTVEGPDQSPGPQFVSKGAQFVLQMMKSIDPELTISEIRSALQKVSKTQAAASKVSRNSAATDGNF